MTDYAKAEKLLEAAGLECGDSPESTTWWTETVSSISDALRANYRAGIERAIEITTGVACAHAQDNVGPALMALTEEFRAVSGGVGAKDE